MGCQLTACVLEFREFVSDRGFLSDLFGFFFGCVSLCAVPEWGACFFFSFFSLGRTDEELC